jgi:thiamine transporter
MLEKLSSILSEFVKGLNFLNVTVGLVIVVGFVWFIIAASRMKWKLGVISEIGISCALSLILGYFWISRMPEGGTVSFAMVPIVVVAIRNGVIPGVCAGVISGLLQYFPDPYFYSIPQFLLDYPFAWGMIGLAGLAHENYNSKISKIIVCVLIAGVLGLGVYGILAQGVLWDLFFAIGFMLLFLVPGLILKTSGPVGFISATAVGTFGRFMMHFLSGNIFFVAFAWPGYTPIGYVAVYIASHLFFEALLCIIAVVALNKFIIKQEA